MSVVINILSFIETIIKKHIILHLHLNAFQWFRRNNKIITIEIILKKSKLNNNWKNTLNSKNKM